jgi:bifunctional DNA-binding transcriptional regulator/antitoxin component of YhaV-PrlF toxin-antitoxin module
MSVETVTLGDRGRLVVPQDVRARHGWDKGTTLVLTDSPDGLLLTSVEAALAKFRASVAGTASPVDELLAERRAEALRERA